MVKHKKILVALGMSLLIGLSGCSNHTDTVKTDNKSSNPVVTADDLETDEPEATTLSPYYIFADNDDKNLAAMFYIGYGNEEKKDKQPKLLQKYDLEEDIFEIVADQDNCEWYAIFPKYIGTKITIEHVELDDNGDLVPAQKLTETEKPVLLCCNQSDIVPSVKVTISYDGDRIEFNPFISLENGELSKVERVYTETQ